MRVSFNSVVMPIMLVADNPFTLVLRLTLPPTCIHFLCKTKP